jgi:hypothetical protein
MRLKIQFYVLPLFVLLILTRNLFVLQKRMVYYVYKRAQVFHCGGYGPTVEIKEDIHFLFYLFLSTDAYLFFVGHILR